MAVVERETPGNANASSGKGGALVKYLHRPEIQIDPRQSSYFADMQNFNYYSCRQKTE